MNQRAYDVIRTMVEEHGGSMEFKREGQSIGGAWIIRYNGKEKVFPSGGRKFPGMDELLVARVPEPKTWDDYEDKLIDNAWEKLLKLLNETE